MAGLRLEHIYKVYPNGTKAVSDFTMDIKDQEFIVFVGPSGCGKSTTLRMIAGLEDISAGELYIDDKIVNDVEPKDRDIAMVFQNYALYPHMTVYENMAFGLKLRHVPNAEIHKKVLWAANVLDLVEYLDRKPRAMSGGQRQRVALGRAILRNPKVMLLDEPLSNLDAKLRTQMRSEISKLHEELKTTFIYVTHDQVEAMTLGTRVVVMRLGKIMQIDTPKNLYDYPNNLFVAGFIGTPQMNIFQATLTKVKDKIRMDFNWSENSLLVPQQLLAKVQPQYFNGKTVLVGLRCEDISLEPDVVKKSKTLVDVRISHFEELGNETLIYGDINMQGDGFGETSTRVIIKGRSTYGLSKGQIVKAALDMTKVHMFDKETEETINPRIPSVNLVDAVVKDGMMSFGGLSFQLPKAVAVPNGNYEVLIPTEAIRLNHQTGVEVTIDSVETISDRQLVNIQLSESLLFANTTETIHAKEVWYLDLDFTLLSFQQNGKTVLAAVEAYDRINAMFLNYATAKSFVGNRYETVIEERVEKVKEKYEPQIDALTTQYEKDFSIAQEVDSKAVMEKNASKLAEKKKDVAERLARLKKQLQDELAELKKVHLQNNERIAREVTETYSKIRKEEQEAFQAFKAINKDRDAYRKRAQEYHEFKENHDLEEHNELEKRTNLEAIRYEGEVNSLKGNFKRTKDNLKKQYGDLVKECNQEAFPAKELTKEYKAQLKKLKGEYDEALMRANIIFFFKIQDLVILSNDAISNKMIQSLGVKVFTKQYLIEVPHDAYVLNADMGLDVEVKELLDYGTKKYLKCVLDDGQGPHEIYLLTDQNQVDQTRLKVTFNIEKVHITEKAMDIKIY